MLLNSQPVLEAAAWLMGAEPPSKCLWRWRGWIVRWDRLTHLSHSGQEGFPPTPQQVGNAVIY